MLLLLIDPRFWGLILLPMSLLLVGVIFVQVYIKFIVMPEENQKKSESHRERDLGNFRIEISLRELEEKKRKPYRSFEELLALLNGES